MLAQDILITHQYILSRPMLEIIESKLPIREWFSRDQIDYFSRFSPEKPIEKFLKYWRNRVDIEVESSSGIMSLTVNAFDASESLAITKAVMTEAERMVNDLSMRARSDAVAESNREMRLAEERLAKIRLAVRDLRNRDGVLDAQKANETNLKVIGELRAARINLAVQLTMSLRDLAPESRRILDMKAQIKDLDDNINRIERQSASQDPDQKRLLSDALTRFEALDNRAQGYREVLRQGHRRQRARPDDRGASDRVLQPDRRARDGGIVDPAAAPADEQPRGRRRGGVLRRHAVRPQADDLIGVARLCGRAARVVRRIGRRFDARRCFLSSCLGIFFRRVGIHLA